MRLGEILHQVNNCMEEYFKLYPNRPHEEFYWHLDHAYGIRVHFDDNGRLLNTFEIVNYKKYDIFLLKYSA